MQEFSENGFRVKCGHTCTICVKLVVWFAVLYCKSLQSSVIQ